MNAFSNQSLAQAHGTTPHLSYAAISHIGMKRSQNQDRFMCIPDLQAFIVADGMGGHQGGETASLITVTSICDFIRSENSKGSLQASDELSLKKTLKKAIEQANEAVHEYAAKTPQFQGMGTTCTALLVQKVPQKPATVILAQVGDSRGYFFHPPASLWQITRDHSLVQEKLQAGLIERHEMRTDKMRNVITRSVGFEATVEVDIYRFEAHPGDVFLLCSDGLSGLCTEENISRTLTQTLHEKKNLRDEKLNSKGSLDLRLLQSVEALVHEANKNGGDDNITAMLVHIN